MIKQILVTSKTKKSSARLLLLVLALGTFLPTIVTSTNSNAKQNHKEILYLDQPSILDPSTLKLSTNSQDNPEAYFPNFIFYSKEIANTLINHLYDNVSGGFYISADEQWLPESINREKRSYDNAQAILALLKLADAVINETEQDYAIELANQTANCLITDLYEETFGGFFITETNDFTKPGVQGKSIQALLALYEETGNETYRNVAINAADFLEPNGWNDLEGYYYYVLTASGQIPTINPNPMDAYDPRSKRVDHNAMMGKALLDLYKLESDTEYLTKAERIFDYINRTCRNEMFFTGLTNDNLIIDQEADIFVNSLVLEYLAQLYNVTEESKYLEDFFKLLNTVLLYFWDNRWGAFKATYSFVDPELRDGKKYTERLFYAIRALDEAYKLNGSNFYYNLILDIVQFLNNKLYDQVNFGYNQLINEDGTPGADSVWNDKYSVTQSLAIFSLSNLWLYSKPGVLNALWTPTTPRAEDSVVITVAAFDANGLSNVLFNYSINDDPYELKEMAPHSFVENMFETSLFAQSPGTRVNFNIIVNDTNGIQVVRGSYFFTWQADTWAPTILEIGFNPGMEIPVNTEFSVTVSAQDTPIQGTVEYVRMFYQLNNESVKSIALKKSEDHSNLWYIDFPNGLSIPGNYKYYFEAIDGEFNYDYTIEHYFDIMGHLDSLPIEAVLGLLITVFFIVPVGLYSYVEYKKKSARRTLKAIKKVQNKNRRTKRKRSSVRGKRRSQSTTELK